jgi:ipoprotein LpqH
MVLSAKAINLAVAGAVVVSGIQACSEPPPDSPPQHGLPPGTASVSINGHDTGTNYTVVCNQIQWLLTIETLEAAPGFTVLVEKGPEATAKFVKIRDVAGFTGSFWRDGVGDGEATRAPDAYTIAGTAYGVHADKSNRPTNATYVIKAAC